jgi:Cu+-exporting ATPase
MHRELSHAGAAFGRPRVAGLYLLTSLLIVLVALDLFSGVRETFGVRFATIAAVVGGARVLYGALDRLLEGRLGADLALAIAVITALAIHEPLVAAEVVVIGLIGECLEAYTFGRTQAAVRKLVEFFPRRCWVLRDGHEVEVSTHHVHVGEVVVIKPGARIPVDGTVRDGRSSIDSSAMTGESLPRDVGPGDRVLAGSVNQFGTLVVEAVKVGDHTVAGRVIELTARALKDKPALERTADRLAGIFLPGVLGLAAITFCAAWIGFGATAPAAKRAVYPTLSVLVVTCPCALILATPAAVIAALGRLAGTGVLVKGGSAIERFAAVRTVTFDKTGTLTEGRLELGDVLPLRGVDADDLIRAAATAEQGSEHPLARVVVDAAATRQISSLPRTDFTALPGAGVRAVADGHTLLVGTRRLLDEQCVAVTDEATALLNRLDATGQTPLLVARDGSLLGVIGARDRIRADAAAVIADLRASGVEQVAILTGDRLAAAKTVAEAVGVTNVQAELLPDKKAEWVRQGIGVAFVGDGINDAPALASATVGLAVGAGSDIAAEAGDVVLMGDPLTPLPLLLRLSRQTVAVIRQNILVFAIGVNAVGILVTAWLWPLFAPPEWADAGPIAGAIYHQIGSLAVLLNSMRLLTFERHKSVAVRQRLQRFDHWLAHTFDVDEWVHWLSHHLRPVLGVLAGLLFIGYAVSGFAAVGPDEVGVVSRFGRLLPDDLPPGLHYRWPWPIESVERVQCERVRTVEIGFRPAAGDGASGYTWTTPHGGNVMQIPDEMLMVTGDGNLVEVMATVRFHVSDPRTFLTAEVAPAEQLRTVAESLLREVIAARSFAELLTVGRGPLEQGVYGRLGERTGGLGLAVDDLTVHDLHPPAGVVKAHHDVARAVEDRDRQINDALAAATRAGRAAEAAALLTERTADARAAEQLALAKAAAEGVAAWHSALTAIDAVDEARLAEQFATAVSNGRPADAAMSDYRQQRSELLAQRRSLTQFRLALEALAAALGGRTKVIVDSDRVSGRRQLLMFEPGVLPAAPVRSSTQKDASTEPP